MKMGFIVAVFALLCVPSFNCLTSQYDNSRLNFFDIDLLRYATEDHPGNVVVSPASIKSTLAMLLEGAEGATAEEIRYALRLSPDKAEFREQLNLYLTGLKSNSKETILENANAAFISDKQKLKKDFDTMLRHVYLTQVYKTDFKDAVTTALSVNSWVNATTRGLIPEIVEPGLIDPSANMLLTNALYFKSTWKFAFDPRHTRGACFYDQGICRMVQMMELNAGLNYAYVDNLRAHAVELPYEGGRYSMILLVPHEKNGWPYVVRDLPYMSLPQISALMDITDVQLDMPKFVADYGQDMEKPLKNMQIRTLFTPYANLSGAFEKSTSQATTIHHKVHMSIDEAGTVAAAATTAVVIPLISRGVQLTVDRPFVFFIRDNKLGLVLFEGKIEQPTPFVDLHAPPPETPHQHKTHKPSLLKRILG